MSGKRRKRDKSRGTIKGGVGGKVSADAEGVEENRERNRGTIQGVVGREALEDEIEVERLISRTCHCSFIKKKKKNKKKNLPEINTSEVQPLIIANSGVSVFSQVFQFQSSQFFVSFFSFLTP